MDNVGNRLSGGASNYRTVVNSDVNHKPLPGKKYINTEAEGNSDTSHQSADFKQRSISSFNAVADNKSDINHSVCQVIDQACKILGSTVCSINAEYIYDKLADKHREEQCEFFFFDVDDLFDVFNKKAGADEIFRCSLICRPFLDADGVRKNIHTFIIIQQATLFSVYQSMADQYTLKDFVDSEGSYCSEQISIVQEHLIKLKRNKRILENRLASCTGEGVIDREKVSRIKLALSEYRIAINQGSDILDSFSNDEDCFRQMCDAGLNQKCDAGTFKDKVLKPLVKICNDKDNPCCARLFGTQAKKLELQTDHSVSLRICSAAIEVHPDIGLPNRSLSDYPPPD